MGVLSLLIKSDSAANADLTSHVTKSDFISSLKEYKISLDQEELDKIFEAIDEMEDDAVNYLHVLDALTGWLGECLSVRLVVSQSSQLRTNRKTTISIISMS